MLRSLNRLKTRLYKETLNGACQQNFEQTGDDLKMTVTEVESHNNLNRM